MFLGAWTTISAGILSIYDNIYQKPIDDGLKKIKKRHA
jgi:hypothetical protein